MERKTKHRILGVLVVIGLIIILLPLFQGEKETTTHTALVTAPPFPDQPVQVTTAVTDQNQIKVAEQTSAPQAVVNNNTPATSADNATVKQQPDDTISVIHPSIINTTEQAVVEKPTTETSEKPALTNSSDDNKSISNANSAEVLAKNSKASTKTAEYKIIEDHKKNHGIKKSLQASKKTPTIKGASQRVQMASDDKDGLIKLKSAAWVIQIGSYKNKANALRLVNQLRANGYRAFIQQVSSDALGDHTRVFIGPENKRAKARALADRLHNEMHIEGIVISYKPLTL